MKGRRCRVVYLSLDINFNFKVNENMKENTHTQRTTIWKIFCFLIFFINISFNLFHGGCMLPTPAKNGGTQLKSAVQDPARMLNKMAERNT